MVKMVCKLPTFVSRKAGKEAKKYALEHVKTPEKQEQLIPKGE